jgi:hypothetical protein
VYAGNEKAPTTYLINSSGEQYSMGVTFTDNTPQPTDPQ